MHRDSAGQASLEYILLFGAGALVALIAFLLLIFLGPYGGNLLNNNIVEYEKIDLCTASDNAACNIFLDWATGLSSGAVGFVVQNESDWRTLKLDGIRIRLFCGSDLCTRGDFPTDANIFFIIPKNPSTGGPCDVDSQPGVCLNTASGWQVSICGTGSAPASTPCDTYADNFNVPPCPVCDASVILDPSASVKFGVGANLQGTKLTSVQLSLHAVQVVDGSDTDPGFDESANKLAWYSGFPNHLGSTFQCEELNLASSPEYYEFGCAFAPGCVPVLCPSADDDSSLWDYCVSQGYDPDTTNYVCNLGDHYEAPECFNSTGASNQPYTLDSQIVTNIKGAVTTFDISALKKELTWVPGLEPTLNVSFNDFMTDPLLNDSCTDDESCNDACTAYASSVVNKILFYSLPAPSPASALCSEISNSQVPAPLTGMTPVVSQGFYNDTLIPATPACVARYKLFNSPEFQAFFNAPGSDTFYLGMRATPGNKIKLQSFFNDNAASVTVYAFYFPH